MRKKRIITLIVFTILVTAGTVAPTRASEKLKIGITLHPYFSYVKNIVADRADVIPLIKEGFNPHNYRPQPDDIKKMTAMDVMVVNGIGHDEFAFEIIDAAEMRGKIKLIYANKGVSLIPVAGTDSDERIVNPHTFISITASIQQIYNISKSLAEIDPENAAFYRKNTRRYVSSLRKMKAEYMKKLADIPTMDFRCATIHGAYGYLLQEFGLEVTAVIEPRHGLKPTASQLGTTIDKINRLDVDVIFSELNFPDKYVDTIQDATGVKLYTFSHITGGKYTNDKFENEIRGNLETLTGALIDSHRKKVSGQDRL